MEGAQYPRHPEASAQLPLKHRHEEITSSKISPEGSVSKNTLKTWKAKLTALFKQVSILTENFFWQ